MLRTLTAALAFLALSAGLARAQLSDTLPMVPQNRRVPEDAGREREAERKYQAAMKNTNTERKAAYDPWRTMRATPTPAVDRHKPE